MLHYTFSRQKNATPLKKTEKKHPYFPITTTSPHWSLSSVPKVAVTERFGCICINSITLPSLKEITHRKTQSRLYFLFLRKAIFHCASSLSTPSSAIQKRELEKLYTLHPKLTKPSLRLVELLSVIYSITY